MANKLLSTFRDFSGGLSEVANDNMNDNELVVAKNAIPGERNGIARAEGTVVQYPQIVVDGDSAGRVKFLIELALDDSVQVLAFCVNKSNASKMDFYCYTTEWALIDSAIPAVLDYFVYAKKLYWLDGTKYRVYDGTNCADVTENGSTTGFITDYINTAVAVEQRGQRWFFGTKNNEVVFTDVGYVNKFTSTNILNVTSGNADNITALHEFNDGLLIFQSRSVFFLEGWDFAQGSDIRLSRLNVTTGTKYPKTVKTIENAILYLGGNGVYQLRIPAYSTKIAASNISEHKISNRLSEMDKIDAYAGFWDGVYYLGIETPTGNTGYRFYTDIRAFFGEYTQGSSCYAPGFMGANAMVIGCDNGWILRYDPASYNYVSVSADSGGAEVEIPFEVWTKSFDVVGAMVVNAKIKKIFICVKQFVDLSTSLKTQIKADYINSAWQWEVNFDESLVYEEGVYGKTYFGYKDTVDEEISVGRKAKRLQFRFSSSETGQPILLYGAGVLFKKKKPKGNRSGVSKIEPQLED